MSRGLVLIILAMSLLSACASGVVAGSDTSQLPTSTSTEADTTAVPEPVSTSVPTTSSTAAPVASPDTTSNVTIVEFGPSEGDSVIVVGVAHDDVLNMRQGPGVGLPIVHTLEPTAVDVVATGTTVDTGSAFWTLVEHGGFEGWVHLSFVAYMGATEDVTGTVVDQLGEAPSAESMDELGVQVSEVFASSDPQSDVVTVAAPLSSQPERIIIDVIGLGDDSVRGYRLVIFGEERGGEFQLASVEAVILCSRGVDQGICV